MELISKGILVFILMSKTLGPVAGHHAPANVYYVPDASRPQVLRIAVMPFENASAEPAATDRLMDTLITYLLNTQDYGVVDPTLVNQQLFDLKLRTPSAITKESAAALKKNLGIDAVLLGKITSYQVDNTGGDSVPEIAVSARLLDLDTLGIIWSTSVVRRGSDKNLLFSAGRIGTLSDLSQLVCRDISSALLHQGKTALAGFAKRASVTYAAKPAAETAQPAVQAIAEVNPAVQPATDTPQPAVQPVAEVKPAEAAPAVAAAAAAATDATGTISADSVIATKGTKELNALLPKVEGFQQDGVKSENEGVPTVEAVYEKGSGSIVLNLMDCGGETVCAELQKSKNGPAYETDEIYSKNVTEKGVVTLSVVRDRYLVSVSGVDTSVGDMKTLAGATLKRMAE